MIPTTERALPFFKIAGIQVSIHWSWFLVAVYSIQSRSDEYTSLTWNVLEYLALFLIVLMHEFGHSLACRSVGGQADRIILWPLGGVAFVSPPPTPAATLWSIAAGPLVNLLLIPVINLFILLGTQGSAGGFLAQNPNLTALLGTIANINLVLLIFNILPIYPLDGGQIFRALLWFLIGPIRSLAIATFVGLLGGAGLMALALYYQSIWTAILAGFLFLNCLSAFRAAIAMSRNANQPHQHDF